MTTKPEQGSPGIFVVLDALVAQRTEQPNALDDTALALGRIGWIGRPIILVGRQVAGRELPAEADQRDAWVRATIGTGAYAIVRFDEPPAGRLDGDREAAVEAWRALREAHRGTWLVTDRPRQVDAAHQAGLKVIVIGPADSRPAAHRPEYQARDLPDAIGHLLTADVFAHPATSSMTSISDAPRRTRA